MSVIILKCCSIKTGAQSWGRGRLVAESVAEASWGCKSRSCLMGYGTNFSRNLELSQTSPLAVPSTTPTFQPRFLEPKHKVSLSRIKTFNFERVSGGYRREYKLSVTQDNYIPLCATYHFACFFHLPTAGVPLSQASWLLQVTSRY